MNPRSTYRLQLNADFRLADVRELIDYFQQLGISDLYLSPLLQAKPGSTHGYDLIDPARVNSEIGTERELEQLAGALRERGMGLLLDIVPNHMSATEANAWWRDVMEHGPASEYAAYFDIDWESDTPGETGRLLLPFLGHDLDECIGAGELGLTFEDSKLQLAYFDRRLPIAATSLVQFTQTLKQNLGNRIPPAVRTELEDIAVAAVQLPDRRDAARAAEYRERATALKQRVGQALTHLTASIPLEDVCRLNHNQLRVLLEDQPYALFHWVGGGRQINYRRFFDISDLAGVRIERPGVFDAMHERILRWVGTGSVTGLRIDHIDGLRDPARYLNHLHGTIGQRISETPYVVVEKILIGDERLPPDWCTAGTTGYDFIGTVNGLFVEPTGWEQLGDAYQQVGGVTDFTVLLYDKKRQVMRSLFPGELRSLTLLLSRLIPDAASTQLEFALTELTARLPVYRTYIKGRVSDRDRELIQQSLAGAREHGTDAAVIDWLGRLILHAENDDEREFVLRWQQFSAPVMAKGLEDTAFYNYHRLISTCEVGADPRQAVCSVDAFHARMKDRQQSWPATMNATSTHDTKRGEDVRARINVLSELSGEWIERSDRWREWHRPFKRELDGVETPDAVDEWLLYQTLIGAWPLAEEDLPDFRGRIRSYMIKAIREAKRRTSWRAQNPDYERIVSDFTDAVLDPGNHRFHDDLRPLLDKTDFYGALNSLSQLVLKLGAPGVPDFYQGNELWSLTLVDPDNRRPVDFTPRRAALQNLELAEAKQNWRDGRIKALITQRGLSLRNQLPDLFATGEYQPVAITGPHARNLIAFERRLKHQHVLFIAVRFFSELTVPGQWPEADAWQNTTLEASNQQWVDVLSNTRIDGSRGLRADDALQTLPFAILLSQP